MSRFPLAETSEAGTSTGSLASCRIRDHDANLVRRVLLCLIALAWMARASLWRFFIALFAAPEHPLNLALTRVVVFGMFLTFPWRQVHCSSRRFPPISAFRHSEWDGSRSGRRSTPRGRASPAGW